MDIENKYGTLEVQKKLLELLKQFDSFCIENRINYSLNDGSLLGAIRHNGFIPWDDDLDIIVDRANYSKLLNYDIGGYGMSIKRKLWIQRIHFLDDEKKETTSYIPTIDIFVYDNTPISTFHRKIKKILIGFVQGMMKQKPDYSRFALNNKLFLYISYNIGKLFTDDWKYRLYNMIAENYGSSKSQFGSCYYEPYNDIGILHKSEVLEKTERHIFEDTEVSIISGYHRFLTELYGDYIVPPNEEDRIPLHINAPK